MIILPPPLAGTPFREFRASLHVFWSLLDWADEGPSPAEREILEGEFGELARFAEQHLAGIRDREQTESLTLDITRPSDNELTLDFAQRSSEHESSAVEPKRKHCDVQELLDALWLLVAKLRPSAPPIFPYLTFELTYRISREALPTNGLVSSILGLTTSRDDEDLVLTGTQLAVAGDLNDTITWYLSNPDVVSGVIRLREFGSLAVEIAPMLGNTKPLAEMEGLTGEFLVRGFEKTKDRFERFVVQQAGVKGNGRTRDVVS